MALRRQVLDYGDEASQYDFESFKEYKKGNRSGLKGFATGASTGATTGAAIGGGAGSVALPGIGTVGGGLVGGVIGGIVGGTAGAIGGNRKMKREYLKYAKSQTEEGIRRNLEEQAKKDAEEKIRLANKQSQVELEAQRRTLYGYGLGAPSTELPMYKDGGVAKMVMINVEKGELAIDPRTMKVIMDFNDVPKHPKGKDVINQKGNVKVPVGTIIIPADKRKEFLAAKPAQRIEIAGEIIESQREKEEGEEMEMEEEQMPMQGQGMMAMMGGEEEDEMERMEYGGYVGDDKETYRGFRKANKQSEDVYKQWEKQTLEAHPNAKKEALRPFYEKHVTPILGNKNEVGFIENSIYDMGIHGTDEINPRVFPNKIKIPEEMIKNLKEKGKNSKDTIPTKGGLNYEMMLQNIMNKDVNSAPGMEKFSGGGYVKKYQEGDIVYEDNNNMADSLNNYLINQSKKETNMYGFKPQSQLIVPQTSGYTLGYTQQPFIGATGQPLGDVSKDKKTKSTARIKSPMDSYLLATGLGMAGAGATQIFGGRRERDEAEKALQELQKKEIARYKPTAELEQQKMDTAAARERAKYGFSAAELAARQQMQQQASRTAYQRGRESGMGGQSQAMLAALGAQKLSALNELAITDERLREQKAQYADSLQRSLAQQYQSLANQQTAQDIRYRLMQEEAYGKAYQTGQENIYAGASTIASGAGYALGSGLSSLLSLI